MFLLLVTTKSTAFSQATSDSIKCFTYSQARKIITDLRQLPIKDSIIKKQDSMMFNYISIDSIRVDRINDYSIKVRELTDQNNKCLKSKSRKSKLFFIFGILLGISTNLIF